MSVDVPDIMKELAIIRHSLLFDGQGVFVSFTMLERYADMKTMLDKIVELYRGPLTTDNFLSELTYVIEEYETTTNKYC